LGIICTNQLDEFEAVVHIKNWIILHPIYSKFVEKKNDLDESYINRYTSGDDGQNQDLFEKAKNVENIKNLFYKEVINVLEKCVLSNVDVNLLIAIGVCYYIIGDNAKSIDTFSKGTSLYPNDHTLWNKLGAVNYHKKQYDKSFECYKKALELNPKYARCWANYGILMFQKSEMDMAAKCLLKSLTLCPENSHTWSYLSATLITSNSNLLRACNSKDLEELLKHYKIDNLITELFK